MPVLEIALWVPQAIEDPPGLQYMPLMPHEVLGRPLPSPTESAGNLSELEDEEDNCSAQDQTAPQLRRVIGLRWNGRM